MSMTTRARVALVVCGDWDDADRCGVAHSERALLADTAPAPAVVDPTDVVRSVRAAWSARRQRAAVLVVYPTRSTVARWRPLVTFLAIAVLRRGDDLRVHLHEYRIFREVRWALNVMLLVGRPLAVVSSHTEQACMARSIAGRLGRVRARVIPPFGPITPSTTGRTSIGAAGSGILGVFGFAGPAKGTDLIVQVVRALPSSYHRLELVGTGWDAVDWPADVVKQIEVAPLGFVATEDLGSVFERWELAVAPLHGGASDGRLSLRIPLAHGTPTVTEPGRPEDLTMRPSHLHLVAADPVAAVSAAVATATDRDSRRRGTCEVDEFERRVRRELRLTLLEAGSSPPPGSLRATHVPE
jgi:hypothetical protein